MGWGSVDFFDMVDDALEAEMLKKIEGSEMCISGDRSSLSTWFGCHVKLLVPLLNNHWFHAM